MAKLHERCVVLKNLPPDVKESTVKDVLEFAHGDFCFLDKHEKLHRHIEFDNDVRWIVLFKSKADAMQCIRRGSWESSVVRGGCHVIPDYCSGCIVPGEWEEETSEDDTSDWLITDNTAPDCALGSSDSFFNSFVKVDSTQHPESDYKTEGDDDETEHAEDIPTFGFDHKNKKTVSSPRPELRDDLMETVHAQYDNDFEACGSDTESPDNLFCSGEPKQNSHNLSEKYIPEAVNSGVSVHLSGERLSSSELFGSGNVKETSKTRHGVSLNGTPEHDRSNVISKKYSRQVSDSEDKKGEVNSMSSNELFGGGIKDKANITSSVQTFDSDDMKEVKQMLPRKTPIEVLSSDERKENEKKVQPSEVTDPENKDFEQENIRAKWFSDVGARETKKPWSVSVRSADLFGDGNGNFQSLEFPYDSSKDHICEDPMEPSLSDKMNDTKLVEAQCEGPMPKKRNLSQTECEPTVPELQTETSSNSSVPYQSHQWTGNYYSNMLQNYATYMQTTPPGQNLSVPTPGAFNPNFMGYHMNQLYQMPYQSVMPPTLPGSNSQPIHQQAHPRMTMPPVVFVPVYMPGIPPVSSAVEKDHQLDDTSEFTQGDVKRNSPPSSQDFKDIKDTFVYDIPYAQQSPVFSQTDAHRGKTSEMGNMYMTPCEVTNMDSEHIYDEIDESKLRSIRSLPKTERIEANVTAVPISSEQGIHPSADARGIITQAPTLAPTLPPLGLRSSLDKQKIQNEKKAENKQKPLSLYEDYEKKKLRNENDDTKSENDKESGRMVLVKGISTQTSKDALELFFENKRKSGGGDIESAEINVKKREAVIEFRKSADAQEVIQRADSGRKFELLGQELTVCEYQPPPTDPFKLFIRNIADTTTDECVTNFIATGARSEPITVLLGETPGTAMVSFETPPDVSKLRELCERRRCEGNNWNISAVEKTRSVKVTGVRPQTSTDSLSLYFENKRRSQGGDVDSVKCREEDYIVTFVNAEDAERVCHTSHTFTVALYYPCLELDEDFIVRIPPPILLEDMDEYILKFILNSKQYKAVLESQLQSHYGSVVWPSADNENNNVIQINCTVDPKDKKGQAKVKDWTEKCLSNWKEISERLSVDKSKNVAVEVWTELKTRLREIEVSHPEAIAVFLENSDCVIVMVGETIHVQNMVAQINDIVTDIEKKLETDCQMITKKKKLRTYEMALLRASRIHYTLKKTLEFEIDNEKREVICKGKQKDVDDALSKLDDKLKSFVKKPVPGMTKQAIDLLFRKEARDYVKNKMIEKKIIGVWDAVKGNGLVMYSKNERDLKVAIEIVQMSVVMDSLELDSEKNAILERNEGKLKVAEYEENHKGFLHFEIQPNELSFVCTDDIHREIKDEFTKLFDLHSVISTFLPADPGVFSYIVTYKRKEITAIEDQYTRLSVLIEVKDSITKPGFTVKGKKDGCKLAVNKLQAMIDSVVRKDHALAWPQFDKFLKSTEGRECIKRIELSEKCVIKVSSDRLNSSELESTTRKKSVSQERRETGSQITKKVKIGSLASENVDVIINSTNKDLDMSVGAISRTLLKAGGDKIEKECKTNYPDGIKPGEVAVTTGGAMKCKALFHGLLVKWDGGQGHAERVMEGFVKNCLNLASRLGHSSIAFPALGTGAMGFPADVVAQMMFDIVDTFEASNPKTSLRTVQFVLWSEDKVTARAFLDAESRTVRRKTSGSRHTSSGSRHSYSHSAAADTFFVKDEGFSSMIGQVSVSVVQGDLTALKAGAIVNSTMDDLNLNSGAISKAILAAAGDSVQSEALMQKHLFMTKGFVVTSPGKLMCQKIIHARARNSMNGWAETIRTCLCAAEQLGLISVAFPALGTGGKGVRADRMARTMIETFQDYVHSSDFKKCLRTIRIVIFDRNMLELFITEAKTSLDPAKAAKRKSFLPDLKDLKFWEQTPTADANPSVTMHVYAGSRYSVDSVVAKIDEIRREKDLFIPKHVYDHLEETHKRDLKRIGSIYGVKVVIEKSRVKVMGYGKQADCATKKAETYIETAEKDIKKGLVASAVKLPSSWTKMKLSDPTKIVMLPPGDADLAWISRKFLQETGFARTSIVKIERIQNPTLFTQYIGKKTQMEIANKGGRKVEQMLWHGTKSTAVDNINSKGFDRNYNSGSSHGVGVYFAMKAATSAQGYCQPDANRHKHIYLAHVLTGEYCVGQGGIRVPPTKSISPLVTYDSTTDNVQSPNFFVIFHDAQAYPSYLITFM